MIPHFLASVADTIKVKLATSPARAPLVPAKKANDVHISPCCATVVNAVDVQPIAVKRIAPMMP